MPELNHRFSRIFNIIGFAFSILGTILFLVLVGLAHFYAHEAGLIIKEWELSELVLDSNKAKILFNSGVILYGVCLFIAFIPLMKYFKEKKKHKIFIPLAIITCVSLIGVGAFSEDQFPVFHYIVALVFYLFGGTLTVYTSTILIKYDRTISIFYPAIGYASVFMLIVNITTRWFFGQAYTQRIAICLIILFFLLVSGKLLLKKEDISNNKIQN
ncbi:MAG: DUF998 domain-containing protein [Candidatus Heimdallarchaeota archaeon]|nr:DUF998 domain-containing protein [Candidatus Heimdallarchaeota archaeon]MCG3254105.1 DUF998 domain-containing protein [Candidatus Heimdallarchaeota archaeon]MCK4291235.1 DUF998 domain-containing protein [Candidatus Heimdallarchaeota archaeon]